LIKLQIDVVGWQAYKIVFYAEPDLLAGPFTVIGKVVRVLDVPSGRFDIGISFVAIDVGHRQALRQYLKRSQPDA
jgi:hypothetical protein